MTWRGGRVVEGVRLLSGCGVKKPHPGFKSLPLRHTWIFLKFLPNQPSLKLTFWNTENEKQDCFVK